MEIELNEKQLAKIGEFRDTLKRTGFNRPVPLDKDFRAVYLQELREALNVNKAVFWESFGIKYSTGKNYETRKPNSSARVCPDRIMHFIANHLGLPLSETNNPEQKLSKVVGLDPELRETLEYLYEHNITKRDLEHFVQIRRLMNR